MKEKFPLTGIVVSLNTPFDQSGHIDFASMTRLIEMHVREDAIILYGFFDPAEREWFGPRWVSRACRGPHEPPGFDVMASHLMAMVRAHHGQRHGVSALLNQGPPSPSGECHPLGRPAG